jgi:hypothetical protein
MSRAMSKIKTCHLPWTIYLDPQRTQPDLTRSYENWLEVCNVNVACCGGLEGFMTLRHTKSSVGFMGSWQKYIEKVTELPSFNDTDIANFNWRVLSRWTRLPQGITEIGTSFKHFFSVNLVGWWLGH